MRADQLDLRELLDFEPDGGIIRFAGQRAVILDVVALGLLRRELIATMGLNGARAILTHFGFAHGARTADALKDAFPWDSEREWRIAGGRLHRLQGLVLFEPVASRGEPNEPFAEAVWRASYEAEQHVLHFGRADDPVCWTLAGFGSGYLSRSTGREITFVEERCVARGDAVCRAVARPKEEWGARPELAFYEAGCLEQVSKTLAAALRSTERRLRTRRVELARVTGAADEIGGIVARSGAMRQVLDLASRVARVDATILVTGESGVGKERMAAKVHDESQRSAGPFVAVNCAALPEALLESELFGHVRGAFTGATQDRAGLFEAASGGTLFLDEIGDVPLAMQVKLLRALQEREIRRVGANESRPIDVRIVAATNRDLAADVAAGRFRQDLYYRLRVVELRIPPLRERPEDILPLARLLLAESVARLGGAAATLRGFTPKAAQQLVRYAWPGNVRELSNAIERAAIVASGRRIDVGDLPDETRNTPSAPIRGGAVRPLADVEKEHILAAVAALDGNRAKAAAALGIGQATLFRKLKAYKG